MKKPSIVSTNEENSTCINPFTVVYILCSHEQQTSGTGTRAKCSKPAIVAAYCHQCQGLRGYTRHSIQSDWIISHWPFARPHGRPVARPSRHHWLNAWSQGMESGRKYPRASHSTGGDDPDIPSVCGHGRRSGATSQRARPTPCWIDSIT